MNGQFQCRLKSYIQPFERTLALEELAILANTQPIPVNGSTQSALEFAVPNQVPLDRLIRHLAYWESIKTLQDKFITLQSVREATVNAVRNRSRLETTSSISAAGTQLTLTGETADFPLVNRRCLRYGTHGIHEYRGKFFPQLVRSLMNVSNIPTGGIVADPMMGSGTTIVEAVLSGCHALGFDINPLSVFISRTKCSLLRADPSDIVNGYDQIRSMLLHRRPRRRDLQYFRSLPHNDQVYLAQWFSKHVLSDLDNVMGAILALPDSQVRDLAKVSLSNILRTVSWQKEDDLRVRRDIKTDGTTDTVAEFLEEFARSVKTVTTFLYANRNSELGRYQVREDDARKLVTLKPKWIGMIDAIITSPPYATALPYIDTDRLSLCYLGLLTRSQHRKRDLNMIGNREITEHTRRQLWEFFQSQEKELPVCIVNVVKKIARLNSSTKVGFRRQNLPPLLAKYFLDMKRVFFNFHQSIKPSGFLHVIVGNNHTIAGGQKVQIKTGEMLAAIAEQIGFERKRFLNMEMLVSRDIFKKNSTDSEVLLSFQR